MWQKTILFQLVHPLEWICVRALRFNLFLMCFLFSLKAASLVFSKWCGTLEEVIRRVAWVSSCTSHILFLCKNWDIFATFVHVDLIRVFLFLFRHCTKRTKVFHKGSPVNDTSYIFARRSHCIRLCWVHRRLFDFLNLIIYFPSLWNIYDRSHTCHFAFLN